MGLDKSIQGVASDPAEIEPRLWHGWAGDVAFYIGANQGQHLGILSMRFTTVLAFEPNHDSYRVASERVRANSDLCNCQMIPVAVSDHEGHVTLAALPGTRQEATGQYVTPGTMGMEWQPQNWDDPAAVQPVRVSCTTIDKLREAFGDPDFVLIDTEGHEWLIIQGAGRTLQETRPGFLIEFHTPDNHANILKVLDGHHYRTETIRHPHYPPRSRMWYQHGWIRAVPIPTIEPV